MRPKAKIEIHYCCQCQWLLRAAWMAQELLSTFADDLESVALAPKSGGTFAIYYQQGEDVPVLIWCRRRDQGFPPIKALKQKVRDLLDPERFLGHLDR
ncbi:selenoprotein W-related protein [Allopseudospirillum japonicum]|uniref:Selenoprotein W-related protein n=1 Tax=Allopseudospirillum japonicum TaxID=64971 RepID=A0A1H6RTG5_9GAMM|nr:SelT/SelW/SelH family protein [Allopseudospirillum japonicum]SEI57726.1 selenoprotein W-related protein [Allopseudospirillum japonicum]